MVAGIPNPVILTPPCPDGSIDPATLFIVKQVGIKNIYRVGGAQAVAAAAFGTETIPKCDKFLGPGSPWVMAAKRLVIDKLDPGISAGPSECLILADETANGKVVALDLAIESEHGEDSSVFLVTPSRRAAEDVQNAMDEVWSQLSERRQYYSKSVLYGNMGGIVLTDTMSEAIEFVNKYAPEHLSIQSNEPTGYLGAIKHA
jgi:histidinol dehydrogenase